MPLTAKEKMRRYRERLKRENPEKYEEQRKKNLARIKSNKKKIVEMTEAEAESKRKEWREEKRISRQRQNELLIVDDSEQSESDHGTGPHFTKFEKSTDDQPLDSPLSLDVHTESPLSRESTSRKRTELDADPLSDSAPVSKKERRVQFSTTKKQTEESFSHNTDRTNCSDKEEIVNVTAECNLYGQLLAQKIKPLDVEDRLVLMNEIDNLVFKHLMNIRKRNKLSRSGHLLSTDQTYSDTRQSIDLPGPSYKSNETQDGSQNNMQYSEYEIPMPFRILKTETEASHQ